jgi:DNA repair exonuclease SbcCD ATPase subunit
MPSEFDASDFVDSEFQSSRRAAATLPYAAPGARPPSREEVENKVSETQQKLADLKRAQEELERERGQLEELRRRQMEFQTGREEMLHHLTRGLVLIEEAEFNARSEAEQLTRTLHDFRDALAKIQAIDDQAWSKENFSVELTRALTTIENARMEWNAARVKYPVLTAPPPDPTLAPGEKPSSPLLFPENMRELCKLGLALTWPLALLGFAIVLILLLR